VLWATSQASSIGQGFDVVLSTEVGKFATRSRRWDEVRRARHKIERVLGRGRTWESLVPADLRSIWRTLAKEYHAASPKSTRCGARQTEVTVVALLSAAAWLRKEGKVLSNIITPPKDWRAEMRTDWEQVTCEPIRVRRLRHSTDEMHRLFQQINNPEVDPRFSLAFALGGEQRIGQVLRCRRSQLVSCPVT
jgi:hypothetical protein